MKPGAVEVRTFDTFGGRTVTVHIPRERPQVIVIAADGQRLASWGADLTHEALPPALIVGLHCAPTEDSRLREYVDGVSTTSFKFDPDSFARHEAFLLHQVVPWVEERFSLQLRPSTPATLGFSAGAEFALAMGLRHPQLFGTVLAASPGAGYRPSPADWTAAPRTYLLAGDDEPFFLGNAEIWANALRDYGADVIMQRRPGAHGGQFWRREFPKMIEWAFVT